MITTTRRTWLTGATAASLIPGTLRHARAQTGPIKIGFLGPLSGPAQIVGMELRVGAETARDLINRQGGIGGRQIEITFADDRGDPNMTISGAHELAGQGANLVLGMALLSSIMALLPQLQSLNMLIQINGATDERLSHELFNRNMFITTPNNVIRQGALAEMVAAKYPDVTGWVCAIQDSAQSRSSWARFGKSLSAAYEQKRGKILKLEDPLTAKVGATDFKPLISQLAASPAKGLFHSLVGSDGVSFFQQARAFGLDKKFTVIAENALDMDLPKALKRSMPDNVYSLSFWSPNVTPNDPRGQELTKAYAAATKDPYPHGLAALGYVSLQLYAEAIRQTGSTDPARIIPALETMKFDTIRGLGFFRKEDHQFLATTCVVHFTAAQTEAGWGVESVTAVDDASMVNPATPGIPIAM